MKYIAALLGGTLAVLPAQAETRLEVAFAFGHRTEYHKCISDKFMEQYSDVKVRNRAASKDYNDAHETIVRQSLINQLPDVHFPGLSRYADLVVRGLAVNLQPFLKDEPALEQQGYIAPVLNLTRVDGTLYGLPFLTGTPIAIYNANLVRRAGGDPSNLPKTWAEMVELAAKIKALASNYVGALYPMWDDWLFQSIVYSAGGDILTRDGKDIAFDDAKGKQAMAALDELTRKGGLIPMPPTAAYQQFATGTVGIIFAAAGRINGLAEQAGNRIELATSPFPPVDPQNSRGMPIGGAAATVLTKDSQKQKAAFEYVKFATGPIGQSCVVAGEGYPPVNVRALEIPSVEQFFDQNPLRKPDVDQLQIALPWVAFPGENGVKIVRTIVDNTERVLQKSATPEQALADMATQVRAMMPRK